MRRFSLGFALLALLPLGCESEEDPASGDGGTCEPAEIEAPEGATLGFLEACTPGQDALCETNLCFNFNARGPKCTLPCTRDCECPAPSSGCSNNGVCKSH
jgi:hypothetical protein